MHQREKEAEERAEQERKIQIVLAETSIQKLIAEGCTVRREELPNGDIKLILEY